MREEKEEMHKNSKDAQNYALSLFKVKFASVNYCEIK